ncbi:MAG: tripartite tricarboxylate transporter permease [Dehalococcoidia bacterium]|nr:tripartite tricarboxylate transporter permease [Dehalococcoidia bacterium]
MQPLFTGFVAAAQPINLWYALLGSLLGTMVGVLPGLGPASALAILFPLAGYLPPTGAIIMLAGIYYGAMYGGSTTAILLNVPGEVASVTTCLDGFQMTRQGRAGPALAMAAIVSFVAGTIGTVVLSLSGPALASVGLNFGPPEYFSLMLFSLSAIANFSGPSLVRGIAMGLVGMILAAVGFDPLSSAVRLTFGSTQLLLGFDTVSVLIGLFAISEVLKSGEEGIASIYKGSLGRLLPSAKEFRRGMAAGMRGTGLGLVLGLVPGLTPSITAFMAYDVEKRISKEPEKFGTGVIEGVAAPEAANNATAVAGFIPLFSLGIPTSPTLAMLLAALVIYGLKPGPLLFTQYADFTWTVIASMYIGNVMLLILNLPLVGIWAKLATVPYKIIAPSILVFSTVGAYSMRNSMFDVWTVFAFGIIGFYMNKLEWPTIPLVLGFILGPMVEQALRQSLSIESSWMIFVNRPLSAAFLALTVALGLMNVLWRKFRQSP